LAFNESELLHSTPPEYHHHISSARTFPVYLQAFILNNEGDPAVKGFYTKVQDHLLGRILHPDWSGDPDEFYEGKRAKIIIVNERFYRHKVMRMNYTGYDVRRGQDSVNSRDHTDVTTLALEGDSDHPFRYARVIGIFHVDVIHNTLEASQTPTLERSSLGTLVSI